MQIHKSLFAIHTKPQNQDFRSPITDVRISGRPEIIVSGPEWVHMARHGLKLCQDGATGSNIIFIHLPGPKTDFFLFFALFGLQIVNKVYIIFFLKNCH